MKRKMNMRIIIIIGFLSIASVLKGANYYVATNGVDTNVGNISLPFLTIQHGSNQLSPGDTLFIRGGTYFEKVFCNATGTIGNAVTITNYQNEVVIIDGTGVAGSEMFVINDKDYVTLDGLVFQNNYISGAKGIYILSEGEGIKILRCTVRNIGWTTNLEADPYSVDPIGQAHGILINGRTTNGIVDIVVSDCKVHDIISGNSEALTMVGNVSEFEISRDTVYDTKNIGIVVAGHYTWAVDSGVDASLNQTRNGSIIDCIVYGNRRFSNVDAPAGIYADGAKNVLISRNTSYDNGNGMSVGCENAGQSASDITVVNNVIYANDNQGIYWGSNAASLENSILKNNTIVENGTNGNFYSEVSLQNSTNCTIIQNILIPQSSSHYAVSIFGYIVSNLIVDNNLAYRYSGDLVNLYVEGTPSQYSPTNSLSVDPMFVDPSVVDPDFSIQSTSLAIDKGLVIYSYTDALDNYKNERLVNGKLDMGAIENQSGKCPSILTIDDTYMLEGKFTAQQEVVIDVTTGVTGIISIFASKLKILGTLDLSQNLIISNDGCQ